LEPSCTSGRPRGRRRSSRERCPRFHAGCRPVCSTRRSGQRGHKEARTRRAWLHRCCGSGGGGLPSNICDCIEQPGALVGKAGAGPQVVAQYLVVVLFEGLEAAAADHVQH